MNIQEFLSDEDTRTVYKLEVPELHESPDQPRIGAIGIVFDTETTGLSDSDKVFEVGAVVFEFDLETLEIYKALDTINDRWDPEKEMHPDASAVTGVTNEDLKGLKPRFRERIVSWIQQADIIVCHNASFDRPRLEELFPGELEDIAFLCTYADLPPVPRRKVSRSLPFLCYEFGGFYITEGHGALVDAFATFAMLNASFPDQDSGRTLFQESMAIAEEPFIRVAAPGVPYKYKDDLREAGLRWLPKFSMWGAVLRPDMAEATLGRIKEAIGGQFSKIKTAEVTFFDKYSTREWE